MARNVDPLLAETLVKYGEDPRPGSGAVWDCHGTWVVYHKAIERIAARAGVVFELPQIIEANTAAKTVAIAVAGHMGERSEWSFGEASPANNKNSYPYAMAEKRAKDRVVLKLVGLHGLAYSEEESESFASNPAAPQPEDETYPPPPRRKSGKPETGWSEDGSRTAYSLRQSGVWKEFESDLKAAESVADLTKVALHWSAHAEKERWPSSWKTQAKDEINAYREAMLQVDRLGAG